MFAVGEKIKLNEELCPLDKRENKRATFGKLGYLVALLDLEFEVTRIFKNREGEEMAEVSILDQENAVGNFALYTADCVLSSKLAKKIDFEILGMVNKNQPEIDRLKAIENNLMEARVKEKKKGVKVDAPLLKRNWAEVLSVRASLEKLKNSKDPQAYQIKHKKGIFTFTCKEDEIGRTLRRHLQGLRREARRITVTSKDLSTGHKIQKIGKVMATAGIFLKISETFALDIIKQHKKPTTNDNYVGIEIEMLSPKTIEQMNKEFVAQRLHRYVNIGTDGSIRNDSPDPMNAMELRICLPESMLEEKIKAIAEVLRKNRCYANRSCGLHVHLDMRNRDPELCYRNFFKVQNIMLLVQPETRRNNRYCMPNEKASLKLKEFSAGQPGDRGNYDLKRRVVINTDSYHKNEMRTIEIRVHEGATKFKDIYNWAQFLVATASLKNELPNVVTDLKDLKEVNYLTAPVFKHLADRAEEFSA